jgi:hypothetical protein
MLGEDPIRSVIRLGVNRSQAYGVTLEPAVISYIDHMMMLGSGFDTDPQVPWAQEILTDPALTDNIERLDRLHAETMQYLDAAVGDDSRSVFFAMARGRQNKLDPELPVRVNQAPAEASSWLERIYPEKHAFLGEDTVRVLLDRGVERADTYGLSSPRGTALFVGLMFLAGGGFAEEPLLPWASEALYDESVKTETERIDRLWTEADRFTETWLSAVRTRGEGQKNHV